MNPLKHSFATGDSRVPVRNGRGSAGLGRRYETSVWYPQWRCLKDLG